MGHLFLACLVSAVLGMQSDDDLLRTMIDESERFNGDQTAYATRLEAMARFAQLNGGNSQAIGFLTVARGIYHEENMKNAELEVIKKLADLYESEKKYYLYCSELQRAIPLVSAP